VNKQLVFLSTASMQASQQNSLEGTTNNREWWTRADKKKKEKRKTEDRKTKTRKKYSLTSKKIHPVAAMADGSEPAVSTTSDDHKNGGETSKEKDPNSKDSLTSDTAPGLGQVTDFSSSEETKIDSSPNKLVDPAPPVRESSYTSDSDPYIYSDDSESLSDAYFRPSFNDYPAVLYPSQRLVSSATSSALEIDPLNALPPHPNSSNPGGYGTLHIPTSEYSASSFKKTASIASIMEDAPVEDEEQQFLNDDSAQQLHDYYGYTAPAAAAEMDAEYLRKSKKERRRLRKQQKAAARQRQMKMVHNQKQRDREQTVSEVKGRPQDETVYHDTYVAYIFVAQLVTILILAIGSASSAMLHKEAPAWATLKQATSDGQSSVVSTAATVAPTKGKMTSLPTGNKSGRRLLQFHFAELDSNYSHLRRLHKAADNSASAASSANETDAGKIDDGAESDADASGQSPAVSSSSSSEHPEAEPVIITKSKSESPENAHEPTSFTIDYRNTIGLIGISGFYACILSYLSFGFMLIMSRALIQVTLVFSILLAVAWGILGLTINPYGLISIMGFGALLLTLSYTVFNWQRVPFASTNLHTALCAMRCTSDITILGMAAIMVSFAWCFLWSMAFIGIVDIYDPAKCSNGTCLFEVPLVQIGLYGFFLISFYWTNSVIKNVLRVTVASTIGTWWYYPQEISPFCSPAVGQPLIRSLTKSLGSICLGSLFSQAAQITRVIGQCFCCVSNFRRHASQNSCENPDTDYNKNEIHTATLATTEEETTAEEEKPAAALSTAPKEMSVQSSSKIAIGRFQSVNRLRGFNRWAYSYIGLYGYGFVEGGERALELFEAREWMDVVRDNLIQNVLMMASIVIGGSTGCFAVLAEEVDGYDLTTFHKPVTTVFVIGSVLGVVLSNVLLLGVVSSAVNTVLICFAAGPFEFNKNHPRLSREMREVWSQQVWEPAT